MTREIISDKQLSPLLKASIQSGPESTPTDPRVTLQVDVQLGANSASSIGTGGEGAGGVEGDYEDGEGDCDSDSLGEGSGGSGNRSRKKRRNRTTFTQVISLTKVTFCLNFFRKH